MVYLFLGQDNPSKDIQLKKLKQEFLRKELEQFNLDTLYGRELTLKNLQEKLLCLPLKSPKRIIIIKGAQDLSSDVKEFIISYVKTPPKQVVLVLDINKPDKKDEFINHIYKYVKILHFTETQRQDVFNLGRSIEAGRADYALRILNQLLREGKKPEMILGGLRYSLERSSAGSLQIRKRLQFLLNCDFQIKTGRLKPVFALEKLVINLCSLGKHL
jgi:DNA polymerase III delta subunit